MMTASPNDVCLAAHWAKHRVITGLPYSIKTDHHKSEKQLKKAASLFIIYMP